MEEDEVYDDYFTSDHQEGEGDDNEGESKVKDISGYYAEVIKKHEVV